MKDIAIREIRRSLTVEKLKEWEGCRIISDGEDTGFQIVAHSSKAKKVTPAPIQNVAQREWANPFLREGRSEKIIQPKWLEKPTKSNTPNPIMSRKK